MIRDLVIASTTVHTYLIYWKHTTHTQMSVVLSATHPMLWIHFLNVRFQAANECYCDNVYGRYGVDTEGCTIDCLGDSSQICGGLWRNSVYEILHSSYYTIYDIWINNNNIFIRTFFSTVHFKTWTYNRYINYIQIVHIT